MNIIFIGDIVGSGARKVITQHLPALIAEYSCEFRIANAENIAGGAGITAKTLAEFPNGLINVFTSGDHVWDQKEFQNEVEYINNFLRPANLKACQPGKGWNIFETIEGNKIAVINLLGRVFMKDSFAECPFDTADRILKQIPEDVKNIIVDIHAEATSEKAAIAYYLDGRVSAVIGTHTHVQTNDAKILPKETAFISDVGMVGPENSILGRDVEAVIRKFRTGMPTRLDMAKGPIQFNAVFIETDDSSGKALHINTINLIFHPENA